MRIRFFSTLLVTVAAATAQSPLTTTFANNNGGSVGGGVYFILTANAASAVTICQMAVNLNSAVGTNGTIDVFTYNTPGTTVPHTPATNWTQVGTSNPVTAAGVGQPSTFNLSTPLTIPAGAAVGVSLRANGVAHAYTNGTIAYPPGTAFANADLTCNAGQASNVWAAGSAFTPRMVNARFTYLLGAAGCPPVATVVSQGQGCDAQLSSFYEQFATAAAFDLANTALSFTSASPNYVLTPGGSYNPVGSVGAAAALALTDDSQVAAGTMGLVVGSNGWVALGAGNSNAFNPTTALMLGNPSTAWYAWHDMNPTIAGSGQVMYEEAPPIAQITYDGVWDFGGTSVADANNIQFRINTATGNVTIAWGAVSALGASGIGHLVGYSPGGPSLDPGPTDLSALVALVRPLSGDIPAISLTAIGTPVQSATAANFNVTTGNIPASALAHIGILGLSRPGLPLAILGAPNCSLNASADVLIGPAFGPFGASFTWTALALPALPPAFFGFQFNVQGAILGTPLNPAFGVGLLTTNGLKCTVGGI